jgi:ATP-dependent protease ClpP protease subunit
LSGDIDFEIDSPGGSVFHGISMYNAIKNYNRGKCRMHVVGDCSSMAAYVMLAGDGDVEFEPNSIVVLHNPWSLAIGDYKAMQKEANILEELAKLYAKAFVERGLFKEAEIRSIMDEETWFMGENLKKLGVVLGEENNSDSEDEETEGSKEIKIAAFRERMNEAKAKLKALKTEGETEKIAALLKIQANTNKEIVNVIEPKEKGENEMVKSLEELKAQNSTVYNEAIEEGKKAEQKRVASLMKFIDVDKNAVIKAINDGVGVSDDEFQSSILMAKTSKKQIAEMEEENPPQVNPETETHAPEGEGEGEELTEEQKAEAQKKADDEKFNALISAMGISK